MNNPRLFERRPVHIVPRRHGLAHRACAGRLGIFVRKRASFPAGKAESWHFLTKKGVPDASFRTKLPGAPHTGTSFRSTRVNDGLAEGEARLHFQRIPLYSRGEIAGSGEELTSVLGNLGRVLSILDSLQVGFRLRF
jgi:hypothetical protein